MLGVVSIDVVVGGGRLTSYFCATKRKQRGVQGSTVQSQVAARAGSTEPSAHVRHPDQSHPPKTQKEEKKMMRPSFLRAVWRCRDVIESEERKGVVMPSTTRSYSSYFSYFSILLKAS